MHNLRSRNHTPSVKLAPGTCLRELAGILGGFKDRLTAFAELNIYWKYYGYLAAPLT